LTIQEKLPVACIQVHAYDRDRFGERWPAVVAMVERAAQHGARLIVVPEGSVPSYVLGETPVEPELLRQAESALIGVAQAYATTIVYGAAQIIDGVTYNAACAIGPDGSVLGFAHKNFLWHFDRLWFAPGDAIEPIATPFGALGVLVCADGRIPTLARTLVDRGAELLVMPTAWVTSGRDPEHLENLQADLLAAVRARENGVPFVVANKAGTEQQSVAYCGKSSIIAADGTFVARAGELEETILYGEIELGGARPLRGPQLDVPRERPANVRRARFAIATAANADDVSNLARRAAQAGAAGLIALGAGASAQTELATLDAPRSLHGVARIGGVTFGIVDDATIEDPAGLVAARLAGVDAFCWISERETAWQTELARARAAELRAYVAVVSARAGGRAFACDPDGAVICGTFGDFRVAAFLYDAERTAATLVAPQTDVLEGLRRVAAIAAQPRGSASLG
jgi:predicted amidohydrolase